MKVQRSMGDQHDGFPRLCHFFRVLISFCSVPGSRPEVGSSRKRFPDQTEAPPLCLLFFLPSAEFPDHSLFMPVQFHLMDHFSYSFRISCREASRGILSPAE